MNPLAFATVPGLAPAGDSLSWAPKKVSKETAPGSAALPAVGCPAMLEARGRTQLASLRSAQTRGAKSVFEARCARASGSCASRRLHKGNSIRLAARRLQGRRFAGAHQGDA